MNMSMCEVPVHPVEFLMEADIMLLPELPMTLDTDGTYYCDGESTQETTKGTNLCNWRNYGTQTMNGVTITADEYGVITLSGTPTVESGIITTYIHNGIDMSLLELGKTYYSNISIQIEHEDHKSWCTSFVFDESMVSVRPYIQPKVVNYVDGEIIKPVLSEGSLTEWEPYTGGIPSPNPDYPQPIINTYPAGTYRAVCGDKVYKVVLDDDLRSVPGVADRVRIDARRGCMWVERKVNVLEINGDENIQKSANTRYDAFIIWTNDFDYTNALSVMSDKFISKIGLYGVWSSLYGIAFSPSQYGTHTIDTIREWLSDNPIIAQYTLSTPTTHQSVPTLLTTIEPAKSLTIENTVNAPTEVMARGDSWQRSTTGAQLANLPDIDEYTSPNGITWKCKNGVVFVCGDVDVQNSSKSASLYYVIPEGTVGTYRISGGSNKVGVYVSVVKSDGTVAYYSGSFSLDGTEKTVHLYLQTIPGSIVGTNTLYPMLNSGSTPLPWEPYTGNAPSPSPEYPQDIISVSGILKSSNNGLCGRDKLRESQIVIPELRAIPGTDVRDELVVYEDGSGKILRRVKNRHLSPDDTFGSSGLNTDETKNFILRSIVDLKPQISGYNTNVSCNIANTGKTQNFNVANTAFAGGNNSNALYICVSSEVASTVDEFKSFVASKDIYVNYEIEPTEEPLTADQVQGILRTHQYHTGISWEGLDEHLEPEVEVKCRVLGR